jgi:flagellar motor protein MotB
MLNNDHEDSFVGDHPDTDEDHDEHIDERWLVSYADMMTLLFGLFVLLYSLATMDQQKAEKIRQSTNEKFGHQKEAKPVKEIDYKKLYEKINSEHSVLLEDLKVLQDKSKLTEGVEKLLAVASQKIEDLKQEREQLLENAKQKDNNIDKLQSDILKTEQNENENRSKNEIIAALQQKNEEQIKDLDDLTKKLKLNEEQMKLINVENQNLKNTRPTLERKIASEETLQKQVSDLEARATAAESARNEMAQKLKNIESAKDKESASKAFLAVFINWPTRDHDIDLVIKDPNGKKFDFKKRKYQGYPGNFALDTRRGPGAELWQSDKIIPGKYSATYSFYNQYGNTEEAKVSGTIYTAKGSFEIKDVQMNLEKNREFHIVFEVTEDGSVQINTK